MTRRVTIAVVATAAALAVLARHDHMVDLAVYRAAGWSVLHGLSPYRAGFGATVPHQALPFTYPPFAAVVFTAFAAVPLTVVRALVAGTAAGLVAWMTFRLTAQERPAWWLAVALAAGVVLLEPMREELTLGQVDVVLTAAVVADCLGWLPRVPRGALTGLAAAVKITPAAFVAYFVAGRERRPTVIAGVTFLVATAASALVAPHDTWTYWTSAIGDASRVGDLSYAANQSLQGALARLGVDGADRVVVWLVAGAVVVGSAWLAAVRLRRRGDDVLALVVVATAALVVAPVAWSHHWVLVGPVLALAFVRATSARARVGVLALAAVFAAGPQWWFAGHRDPAAHWSSVQSVVGDAYLWAALGAVGWVAWRERRGNTAGRGCVPDARGPTVGARSGPRR